jgi:hypothetical protein
MRIETDAFIERQQPGIRACVATVCREIDLDAIRNPETVKAYARRYSLICGLHVLGLKAHEIAYVLEMSADDVRDVLRMRRESGQGMRTQRWA